MSIGIVLQVKTILNAMQKEGIFNLGDFGILLNNELLHNGDKGNYT